LLHSAQPWPYLHVWVHLTAHRLQVPFSHHSHTPPPTSLAPHTALHVHHACTAAHGPALPHILGTSALLLPHTFLLRSFVHGGLPTYLSAQFHSSFATAWCMRPQVFFLDPGCSYTLHCTTHCPTHTPTYTAHTLIHTHTHTTHFTHCYIHLRYLQLPAPHLFGWLHCLHARTHTHTHSSTSLPPFHCTLGCTSHCTGHCLPAQFLPLHTTHTDGISVHSHTVGCTGSLPCLTALPATTPLPAHCLLSCLTALPYLYTTHTCTAPHTGTTYPHFRLHTHTQGSHALQFSLRLCHLPAPALGWDYATAALRLTPAGSTCCHSAAACRTAACLPIMPRTWTPAAVARTHTTFPLPPTTATPHCLPAHACCSACCCALHCLPHARHLLHAVPLTLLTPRTATHCHCLPCLLCLPFSYLPATAAHLDPHPAYTHSSSTYTYLLPACLVHLLLYGIHYHTSYPALPTTPPTTCLPLLATPACCLLLPALDPSPGPFRTLPYPCWIYSLTLGGPPATLSTHTTLSACCHTYLHTSSFLHLYTHTHCHHTAHTLPLRDTFAPASCTWFPPLTHHFPATHCHCTSLPPLHCTSGIHLHLASFLLLPLLHTASAACPRTPATLLSSLTIVGRFYLLPYCCCLTLPPSTTVPTSTPSAAPARLRTRTRTPAPAHITAVHCRCGLPHARALPRLYLSLRTCLDASLPRCYARAPLLLHILDFYTYCHTCTAHHTTCTLLQHTCTLPLDTPGYLPRLLPATRLILLRCPFARTAGSRW